MKTKLFSCFIFACSLLFGQKTTHPIVEQLDLSQYEKGQIHNLWLKLGEDTVGEPIKIPVIVARGTQDGEVLGLTAAIHGNELNGIAIIQRAMSALDMATMKGSIIAIPGLNPMAIANNQREFIDLQDLNRLFPGKLNGNRSQQMAYQIAQKVIPLFDYHVDLHTASFGRVNTLYGRGDMQNDTLSTMLRLVGTGHHRFQQRNGQFWRSQRANHAGLCHFQGCTEHYLGVWQPTGLSRRND